jgi:hypothetical protein
MDEIDLSAGEVMLARLLASLRTGLNRVTNVKSTKFGDADLFHNEILGVAGEIAFAKSRNLYLDLSFDPRKGGTDFICNGKKVDVKTTERDDGRLLVPIWKTPEDSDIFVLVTGKVPTFKIRGFATSDEVFANRTSVGHGPCYAVPQNKLHQIADL